MQDVSPTPEASQLLFQRRDGLYFRHKPACPSCAPFSSSCFLQLGHFFSLNDELVDLNILQLFFPWLVQKNVVALHEKKKE